MFKSNLFISTILFLSLFINVGYSATNCRALTFSGAGAFGAYEVKYGSNLQWDLVTGISAGAINAAAVAMFNVDDTKGAADFLVDRWLKITPEQVYVNWKGGVVDGALFQRGIYNTEPLTTFLTESINITALKQSDRGFMIGATNLDTGMFDQFYKTDSDIVKAVAASASIPGLFPPTEKNGYDYADGGVTYLTPITDAARLCYETGAINVTIDMATCGQPYKFQNVSNEKTVQLLLRSYQIIKDNFNNKDIETLFQAFPNAILNIFRPSKSLPGTALSFTYSAEMIPIGIKDGENENMIQLTNNSLTLLFTIVNIVLFVYIDVTSASQVRISSNNNNNNHIYINDQHHDEYYNDMMYDDAVEINKQPPSIFQIFYNGLTEYFIGSNMNTNEYINHDSDSKDNNHRIEITTSPKQRQHKQQQQPMSSTLSVEQVLKDFNHFAQKLMQHYFGNNDKAEQQREPSFKVQKDVPLLGLEKANQWKKKINNLANEAEEEEENKEINTLPKLEKIKSGKPLFHNDNIESLKQSLIAANDSKSLLCNSLGYLTFSNEQQNTCQGSTCAPAQLICDGNSIIVNKRTPYDPDYDYSKCRLVSMNCKDNKQPINIYNLQDQYKLKSCQIKQMKCSSQFLYQCQLLDVNCDNTTSFGINTFGFSCSNQQLVCGDNNTVVPPANFTQYNTQIKNGECSVQNIPCTPKDECLLLDLECKDKNQNCSVTIEQQLPCMLGCNANLNTSSCDCPSDFSSMKCDQPTPITCSLNLVSPQSKCPGENYVMSKKTCFEFDYHGMSNFSFNLDCHFVDPVPTSKHNFTYWIDLPNLKLSTPVSWSISNSIIDFNRLYDYSFSSTNPITREEIMQLGPIWINTTLSQIPSTYWIAKRLYFETVLLSVHLYFIKLALTIYIAGLLVKQNQNDCLVDSLSQINRPIYQYFSSFPIPVPV
ncbi:hypothetical protein PPL_11534 [Heterostelium album PN500]|uniref:PNPLA domain-containing protein n=1 Tax=Heterostelium pallidum (strain ATCC 26659 / Pp 5 / PN500) TaxID=670386 RepID=D3BV63_HETP5|nr:hypothetical protein PPL_11534 [Heterostelium album PN500]EFA74705.1 hypothetical protein PPL_11534 [Heterostelium album PN500]|eukprot:XP_020426839.1 hypothetical protein PPL_11534 [Heterostelium album PN500]